MTLGEAFMIRLNELLKQNNLTLYKFLKDSLIPWSTVKNIERGKTKSPTLKLIYQVASGFNMSHIEFLNSPIFFSNEIEYL